MSRFSYTPLFDVKNKKRSWIISAGAALVVAVAVLTWLGSDKDSTLSLWSSNQHPSKTLLQGKLGEPTLERLKPELFYFTAGRGDGLNNQIIAVIEMVHIALHSNRIAILPPFAQHGGHQQTSKPLSFFPVEKVFDLPRLQRLIPIPGILDWTDIRPGLLNHSTTADLGFFNKTRERIGCWGSFQKGGTLDFTGLDVEFTPLPDIAYQPSVRHPSARRFISYIAMLPFLRPRSVFRQQQLNLLERLKLAPTLPASDHLACIDNIFYGSDLGPTPEGDFGPGTREEGSWLDVGRFAYFTPELTAAADHVLRMVFGWADDAEETDFIGMHIRRGDTLRFCESSGINCQKVEEFEAGLAHLQERRKALGLRKITNVLVTTDDRSVEFLDSCRARGWKVVEEAIEDEIRTLYGEWYTTFIDNVLLSRATDLVGSSVSTMSLLAGYRVKDWNNGLVTMVNGAHHIDY